MAIIDGNDDGGSISKFNPAGFKMSRLHEINKLINECKLDIDSIHPERGKPCSDLLFQSITNLFQEGRSKMGSADVREIEALKNCLEYNLLHYPLIETIRRDGMHIQKWKANRWVIYKPWFEKYENIVRLHIDKHGLDTPTEDESALF